MTPIDFLKVLRRRWPIVVACFAIAAAAGYILSPEQPPAPRGSGYQASLTLIPSLNSNNTTNLHLAAHLATGPDVARLAAEKMPAEVDAKIGSVTASVQPDVGSLTITANHPERQQVGILAEVYAEATVEFLQSTTGQSHTNALEAAQTELSGIEENIAELQTQLNDDPNDEVLQAQLQTELTRYGIVFQQVQDLLSADEPVAPLQVIGTAQITELDPDVITAPTDRRVRALLAGSVGLLLGLCVAFVMDRLDTKIRERDAVEDVFGLPVLAEVPRIDRRARNDHALVMIDWPNSAAAEAYRSLRSAITILAHGRRNGDSAPAPRLNQQTPQVLVVTGAGGDEGKSTTVVNLAAALAEVGRSVLVLDCDFRKPEAHLFLDAPRALGLAEADLVDADLGGGLDQVIWSTSLPRVHLITSGQPVNNPAGVMSRLSGVIAEARNLADVVLVDSSPLLATSEALDVLQYADAALVTCRLGGTTYSEASRGKSLLERSEVPVLGVVLTNSTAQRGAPYGQPSKSDQVRAKITSWLRAPDLGQTRNGRPGVSGNGLHTENQFGPIENGHPDANQSKTADR